MKIGELFMELGFKSDTMKLKDFMHAVGDLNMRSVASAVGLGALYEATAKIMGITGDASNTMYNFSQQTGLSAQEMTRFAQVVSESGGDAKEAEQFIRKIQMDMALMAAGQPSQLLAMWRFLNINPYQLHGVADAVDKIQGSFGKMNTGQKLVAIGMGLPQGLQNAFQSTKQLSKAMEELGALTDDQAKKGHEWWSSLQRVLYNYQVGLSKVGSIMAGPLTGMNKFIYQTTDPRHLINTADALSGENGLFTKMYLGWDKLTGKGTQVAPTYTTVHVTVNGAKDPHEVAKQVVEEANRRDRNSRYYGDNGNQTY